MTQLISAKQLADKLGVSVRTLEDLIIRGVVPPHIKLGRLRRWDSTQVDAWLQGAFQTHDARATAGAGIGQSVAVLGKSCESRLLDSRQEEL